MSQNNNSIDTIKTRIEMKDLKPYDGLSSELPFFRALSSYPHLSESLEKQLCSNEHWVEKASTGEIFFILNDDRRKRPEGFNFKPTIRLSLIGPEESPCISINL